MNDKNKFILTKQGLEEIRDELEKLYEERKQVAAMIKEARSYGDISENSEYSQAKERQAMLEGRIAELENILRNAIMAEDSTCRPHVVCVGSKVKVRNLNQEIDYVLVGATQSNPKEGKISVDSPVGKALLGKSVGEEVVVQAPSGQIKLMVKQIA